MNRRILTLHIGTSGRDPRYARITHIDAGPLGTGAVPCLCLEPGGLEEERAALARLCDEARGYDALLDPGEADRGLAFLGAVLEQYGMPDLTRELPRVPLAELIEDASCTPEDGKARFSCRLAGEPVSFDVELFHGELKHFYPDWKNYYYLPEEDTAVHKSVGAFIDRGAREKASPGTAYTKKTGTFLPVFSDLPADVPLFSAEYGRGPYYCLFGSLKGLEPSFSASYICGCLRSHLI